MFHQHMLIQFDRRLVDLMVEQAHAVLVLILEIEIFDFNDLGKKITYGCIDPFVD
jgi:hypothetical protein